MEFRRVLFRSDRSQVNIKRYHERCNDKRDEKQGGGGRINGCDKGPGNPYAENASIARKREVYYSEAGKQKNKHACHLYDPEVFLKGLENENCEKYQRERQEKISDAEKQR